MPKYVTVHFTFSLQLHRLSSSHNLLLFLTLWQWRWSTANAQLLVCIPNIFNTWRWLTANAQPHTSHAWLSGWVVRVLDLWSTGCGFKSHLPCCRVQLGQVFFTCRLLSSTSTTGTSQQVAWKATVGLASHWPGITNISGFPPTD